MKSLVAKSKARIPTLALILLVSFVVGLSNGPQFGVITFGVLPSPSSFAILTTDCHLTGHDRPLTAIPSVVVAGTSGTILFNCAGDSAFTVMNPGLATPQFSLPTGYGVVTIVAHFAGSTACTPGQRLVSDQQVTFTRGQSFDYCVSFSNSPATGLETFSLTWTRTANNS